MPTKGKPDPGPSLNKCPCGKILKNKPAWIACDLCDQWWHGNCVNLTKQILGIFREKKLPFKCPPCIVANIQKSESKSNPELCPDIPGPAPKESQSVKGNIKIVAGDSSFKEEISDVERSVSSLKNLVIIDGLRKPDRYQNSREIKAEVKKHKGDLKIKYAHALNRGGIAIALDSEEDTDSLKSEWPVEAFENSGLSMTVHDNSLSIPKCILKNIPPFQSIDRVLTEIKKQTGITVTGRRLRYRDSNKPMPIVVINCSSFEDLQTLFKADILIQNRKAVVKSYRSKTATPLRCYNCQEFGHIARLCKKGGKCETCAKQHTGSCGGIKCCVNCGGEHRSNYTGCPVFMSIKERLLGRKLRE